MDGAPLPDAARPPDAVNTSVLACFLDDFVHPPTVGPNYDQFHPIVGSHCKGTNHQDIQGVERVVFVGDSITVGSPPTPTEQFYRSRLAVSLADRFGLTPPDAFWMNVNPLDGVTFTRESGDFASCAKWGARTDDLRQDNSQLEDCMPEDKRGLRTLVVLTMGGNDVFKLNQSASEGVTVDEMWTTTHDFVRLMREAVTWIKEPGRFPNGVYVIFGDLYEFTDATGDLTSCPAAVWANLDISAVVDDITQMVIYANEQYASIAVDTGSDMIFPLELFCGHGFRAADPTAPCYRGPGMERWFDDTCIHPNPTGHAQLADMFMAVINE